MGFPSVGTGSVYLSIFPYIVIAKPPIKIPSHRIRVNYYLITFPNSNTHFRKSIRIISGFVSDDRDLTFKLCIRIRAAVKGMVYNTIRIERPNKENTNANTTIHDKNTFVFYLLRAI